MQFKSLLLTATSTLTFGLAAPAIAQDAASSGVATLTAQTGDDTGFGDLDPLGGQIDAFGGQIDAFGGIIDAFGGQIDAFGGLIDAFGGQIDAFGGQIDAFGGQIDAFGGQIDAFGGQIDAFGGQIDAFGGIIDAFGGIIDAFGGQIDAFSDDDRATLLNDLFDNAEASLGAIYEENAGVSFDEGFKSELLEKYDVDLDDPESFADLDAREQARFLLSFYDNLMLHSGMDLVDHWMGTVNWSLPVAQYAGYGEGVTVGLLDTTFDEELIGGEITRSAKRKFTNLDHGAGVAGIIAGAHDGQGVMGIAPSVNFQVFNPFDDTSTADWKQIEQGITELGKRDASVINMSLGVSGQVLDAEWASIFTDKQVVNRTDSVVFVKAAGNDGATQTNDVNWDGIDTHNRLLIVGSVGPNQTISSFSNRPGEACLLQGGVCAEEDKLKYRFLVAAGEAVAIQGSDGTMSRASGTSLATPMVTGAVALLQSRWGWLTDHPVETSDIILQSATDLGEVGVDSTYGWGLLNIEASQAPLDSSALYVDLNGVQVSLDDSSMTDDLMALVDNNATITAFEDIGETYRDFSVSVSNLGAAAASADAAAYEQADDYLAQQAAAPAPVETTTKKKKNKNKATAFNDLNAANVNAFGSDGSTWTMGLTVHTRDPNQAVAPGTVPFTTGMTLKNQKSGLSFKAGAGAGMMALTGTTQFARRADYDVQSGGVNPFLGLASGGNYAAAAMPVGERLSVSFGFTENTTREAYTDQYSGQTLDRYAGLTPYAAQATTANIQLQPSDSVTFRLGATQLDEENGLFGGQGTGVFALDGGTQTQAITADVEHQLSSTLTLAASITSAQTRGNDTGTSLLQLSDGGVTSLAYEVAVEKADLWRLGDVMRLSIAQPLAVSDGTLLLADTQVINRETGERGTVLTDLGLADQAPRYVSELLYGRTVFDQTGTLSAFGQLDSRPITGDDDGLGIAGGFRLDINF